MHEVTLLINIVVALVVAFIGDSEQIEATERLLAKSDSAHDGVEWET